MYKGVLLGTATVVGVVALGVMTIGLGGVSSANSESSVTVRDAAGIKVGTVRFSDKHTRNQTEVRVRLQFDPTKIATNAFHGMHLHANGDPANGVGCVADPAKEPATWFVSADGHWKADGQDHAAHYGDVLSVFVNDDGSVDSRYTVSRIDRAGLAGKAIIVHALSDNFGNVPVGPEANKYTANSGDAITATKNTGNAGARVACGVIGER
jgi:superoxide dismutase, Cu-Zn family